MIEKRNLAEILALYKFEPNLVDIYVEGEGDKAVVTWFLSRIPAQDVNVYSIDAIDIPAPIMTKYDLTPHSNRSRVLALSIELYKEFQESIKVLCIADRDYDEYFPRTVSSPLLQLTDGHSMECYALNEICFRKFSSLVLGESRTHLLSMIPSLQSILREVYAIRLANETLRWGMEFIPFGHYISVKGLHISFKKETFIKAYLQKNRHWAERDTFLHTVEDVTAKLSKDPQKTSRGHDIAEVLIVVLRKLFRNRKFGNSETLEGALLGTVEYNDLKSATLFRRLSTLVSN
jgi:hypothetical protein